METTPLRLSHYIRNFLSSSLVRFAKPEKSLLGTEVYPSSRNSVEETLQRNSMTHGLCRAFVHAANTAMPVCQVDVLQGGKFKFGKAHQIMESTVKKSLTLSKTLSQIRCCFVVSGQ